ncbi:hypothetical protein AtNW77_Chr5g0110441 [Arabidopsis thaliana]|uniref:Uncharacterized protein n=1 Tax=Arabidopsis thaliana TaxID=3702 RepID=A0A1P8BG76_ARATH|nr:uncharacterized protein AT5G25755 [Arabidopsis thaliana]NP_001332190.1 uncharacterized protein AT5G25755 [Arabidopsis thaliana]ANM70593.1 hypothetical protein AT5G25755 [Arabidopsis thaliana]ANM70594.1 hypothetical protein AT5G25755 [Arabidopsis thaliana]|eukprot:NP_001332189.1 hypothetical protein AT5G25755 [Arabidopsis thaliana]
MGRIISHIQCVMAAIVMRQGKKLGKKRTREDHDQLKLNRVYWRELLIQKMLITKTSFTLVRQ